MQLEAVIVRRLAGVWALLPAPLVRQGLVWALAERSPALHTRYTRHISIFFLDLQLAKDKHPRIICDLQYLICLRPALNALQLMVKPHFGIVCPSHEPYKILHLSAGQGNLDR